MQLPRRPRRRSSIVLTALVDVMFVLLFFFMMVAGADERRHITLGLPALASAPPSDRLSRVLLDLISAEQWQLQDRAVAPADLESALRASGAARVLIRAASGVPVQALTDALGAARAADVEPNLATAP